MACFLGTAVFALSSALPGSALARTGELDPTYGSGGIAMTGFGVAGPEPRTTLLAGAEGTAVLENEGTVVRLRADGAVDKGFGSGGRLVLPSGAELDLGRARSFGAGSVAVDAQGRILAFGTIFDSKKTATGPEGQSVMASVAAVVRYTPEGKLDRSFGGGKGYFEGSLGIGPSEAGLTQVDGLGGAVDAKGRPVFVVGSPSPGGGCLAKPTVTAHPVAVARLTEAGELDPSFGGGGVVRISGSGHSPVLRIAGTEETVIGVGRQGGFKASCGLGTTIFRLGGAGEPVAGFGNGGHQAYKRLKLSLVEPPGALVLSGQQGKALTLSRFLADGSADPGFGAGGTVKVELPLKAGIHVRPATVDSQGRILLAGFVGSPTGERSKAQPKRSSFVVGRLLPNGEIDPSFGKDGWIFTRLPQPLELISARATFDPEGRLLVGGIVNKPGRPVGAFAVARYLLGS